MNLRKLINNHFWPWILKIRFIQPLKYSYQLKKASRLYRFKTLGNSLEEIRSYKKSDHLFIIGGGESLNTYSKKEWDFIKSHDILIINDNLLLDLDANYYFIEAGCKDSLINNIYVQNERMLKACILYRYDGVFSYFRKQIPKELLSRVFLYSCLKPGYESMDFLRRFYLHFSDLKFFRNVFSRGLFLDGYGSVVRSIQFGLGLDYKKITLCGVDLNSGAYFFDSRKSEFELKGMMLPINSKVNQTKLHNTADKSKRETTVDEVIYKLNECWLSRAGVELNLYRQTSLLFPGIPVFKP